MLPAMAFPQPAPETEPEDRSPKPWIEAEVALPPFPTPGNLLKFAPNAGSRNEYFLDAQSIAVGADGVVRYTLIIRSPSGAQNISYEGIRCSTREQKYYAFGRPDGTWSKARSGMWKYIEYQNINRQHDVLYADYFCPDRKVVKTVQDAINRLKYGWTSQTN